MLLKVMSYITCYITIWFLHNYHLFQRYTQQQAFLILSTERLSTSVFDRFHIAVLLYEMLQSIKHVVPLSLSQGLQRTTIFLTSLTEKIMTIIRVVESISPSLIFHPSLSFLARRQQDLPWPVACKCHRRTPYIRHRKKHALATQ